jgi:hypothetical protein
MKHICTLVADPQYACLLLAIRLIWGMVWASEVTHDKGGDGPMRGHRDDNTNTAHTISQG